MSKSHYIATIGLEIHAELKTATKMFCNSRNDPDERRPNVNVCPVCMGYPGTLPAINKEAVKNILKIGCVLGGKISAYSEFVRKNYFYPDLPKGYQISQYSFPLVKGGRLKGIHISRVHLEEDTGKSLHELQDGSLLDFNRAGVPLMELVTEPDIHSGKDAADFARELQLLLQYLGVGSANMEKGEMRVEANVSVSSEQLLGTKVEVKNLNSFRSVERAIAYEVKRQIELIEQGIDVLQETRGWDEVKELTFSQRQKEESQDYRYFRDPDLPALLVIEIPEFREEILKKDLPELPWDRRKRYGREYGMSFPLHESFIESETLGAYLEAVSDVLGRNAELRKLAVNYISSDYVGLLKKMTAGGNSTLNINRIPSSAFASLIRLVGAGTISSHGAKAVLPILFEEGGDPEGIADRFKLIQKSDKVELRSLVKEVIDDFPEAEREYRSGKTAALEYLIGQAMKASQGRANPELLRKIFEELL